MIERISAGFDGIMGKVNTAVSVVSASILAIVFLMVSTEIFSRYIFQISFAWVMELSRFGLVFIIFLAGSILFYENGHIAVTMLHDYLHPKAVEVMKLVFDFATVYFLHLFIFSGYDFALAGQTTPSTARLMYLMYPRAIVPIGFFLMTLQVVNNIFKRIVRLQNMSPQEWDALRKSKAQKIVEKALAEKKAEEKAAH